MKISHNESLNGLRGLAALNVAVCHFVAAFIPSLLYKSYPGIFPKNTNPSGVFDLMQSPFMSIFYNGHFSVLVFFVLSGYVLSLPNYSGDVESIRKRFWGRYFRLGMPIAASIVISFIIYKLGWYQNIEAGNLSGSVMWLNNFFPAGIDFNSMVELASYKSIVLGDGILNPPLWTLKIEFIGSIYLLAFYLCKPKGREFIPVVAAGLLLYVFYKAESIFYIAIFAGALLHHVKVRRSMGVCFLIVGLYFGAFQFDSIIYNLLPNLKFSGVDVFEKKTFYNSIGAILVTVAASNGIGKYLLESRVVIFLGRVSFPLYLVHMLLLCSLGCAFYINFHGSLYYLLCCFVLYISACLIFAYLFECYVDAPSIKLSRRFSGFITNKESAR